MNIEYNKCLFYACAGMASAGNEGYNHEDAEVVSLVNKIKATGFPEETISWFRRARTGQVEVSPYWPRGSCLAAASFFTDSDLNFDLKGYLDFNNGLNGVSDPVGHSDFEKWISGLPIALYTVDKYAHELWVEYLLITGKRAGEWNKMVNSAKASLNCFFLGKASEITFSPNLLNHYSTDFVTVNGRVITIGPNPDAESMLHETLHTEVARYIDVLLRFAQNNHIKDFADWEVMKEYGYLEDESEASAAHVMEESFVRALSVYLAGGSEDRLKLHSDLGFFAVPFIAKKAEESQPCAHTLGVFMNRAMDAFCLG